MIIGLREGVTAISRPPNIAESIHVDGKILRIVVQYYDQFPWPGIGGQFTGTD